MKRIYLVFLLFCTLPLLSGCACKHENTDLINAIPAQCEQEGYSGDLYCNDCKETLERGMITASLEHIFGDLYNIEEVSCTHNGYTGDIQCSTCGKIDYGEIIVSTGHQIVNYTCQVCGWLTPGLYINNELEVSWDELKTAGYLKVNKGRLSGVDNTLSGRLVVDEEVKEIGFWTFKNCSLLHEIILPDSLRLIEDASFESSGIESLIIPEGVGMADPITRVFAYCENLKSIDLSGCELIYNSYGIGYEPGCLSNTFIGCSSLESVTLPAGITEIHDAFWGCRKLKELVLPEGFLGFRNFYSYEKEGQLTSLERVVWPVSMKNGSAIHTMAPNLKQICYTGSETLWNLTTGKELFSNIEIIFNYVP